MTTLTDEDLTRLLGEAASAYEVPERGADEILAALADEPARVPVVRRRWVHLSAASLVLAGAVFAVSQAGGQGASESGGSATALSGETSTKADSAVAARAPAFTNAQKAAPAAAPAVGGGIAAGAGEAAAPGVSGVGGGGSAVKVDAPPADGGASRVVKTGTIALVVKDKQVTPTLTAVERAAKSEGGYVAASTSDEDGETPSGEVTIRVPVDRFESLVADVRGLNAKVRTASTAGKDVSAQFSDLESQLRTLRATRERFLVILGQTKTISEILSVQQRVDTVSGQIDSIEGQRKLLASQSDLSTLSVSVSEDGDPVVTATQRPRSGLSQAFIDAKNGFVSGVEAIIRHSGGFVLFLLCAAVVLAVGRLTWRVARRRMV